MSQPLTMKKHFLKKERLLLPSFLTRGYSFVNTASMEGVGSVFYLVFLVSLLLYMDLTSPCKEEDKISLLKGKKKKLS